jgi:hypothetical protein
LKYSFKYKRALLQTAGAAVFPTRHETFCYAAREFRVSGVPVIVSDIPAFKDLIDSELALPCSLSVNSVAESMKRLLTDKALRQRMSRQYETDTDLPDGYASSRGRKTPDVQRSGLRSVTALILCPQGASPDLVETSVKSVREGEKYVGSMRLVRLSESLTGEYALLGRRWSAETEPESPDDYFVCLYAGDIIDAGFFRSAAEICSSNESIGVVSANRVIDGVIDEFLWNLSPELRPDDAQGSLRALILNRNHSWDRLFNQDYSLLGEVAAIYSVLDGGHNWIHLHDVTCHVVSEPRPGAEVVIAKKRLMQEFGSSAALSLRLAADLVYYNSTDVYKGSLRHAIESGHVPQVSGARLNLRTLASLIVARVRYLTKAKVSKVLGLRAER